MTMRDEGQTFDRKSLRILDEKRGFKELAKDCVCFANGPGGELHIGIEDGQSQPPADQTIDRTLLDRIRKRVGELTVNVQVVPAVQSAPNGGEYIVVGVPRAIGVASTSSGRYFLRIGDDCKPITGDDVMRLAMERPSVPWETNTGLGVTIRDADDAEVSKLIDRLLRSNRVKASVKEKSADELLHHYGLAINNLLTNLGVLLVGTANDRMRLGTAPVVQALKFDEVGNKVSKAVWDDYTDSPLDLIEAVWSTLPDFKETYEIPDGLFRAEVPAYDEAVIRELLVNALVHRPYTQRGDIFLRLYPDRLEVTNVGRLPLGVTPRNILHQSRRRNDGLARIFHDVGLMEREGSGFDLIYDRLLTSGRTTPTVTEGEDSVKVTVPRRVLHPAVAALIEAAEREHQLSQRERIALGLLGQDEGLSAVELAERLELESTSALRPWLSRLQEAGLVEQTGRGRGTKYFVKADLLRRVGLDEQTTLERIEPHRLRELILEDLKRYPDSGRGDIHRRTVPEISPRTVSRHLKDLVDEGVLESAGKKRWTTYRLKDTSTDI